MKSAHGATSFRLAVNAESPRFEDAVSLEGPGQQLQEALNRAAIEDRQRCATTEGLLTGPANFVDEKSGREGR